MRVKVKVKPNAEKEEIVKINDGEYFIKIKERAENGKANIRLINIIAKELKVNVRNVKIKNPKSRVKILDIIE